MRILSRLGLSLAVFFTAVGVLVPGIVQAGQGFYTVDKSVRSGMVVSLTQNSGVVEPATDKNMTSLLGVIGSAQTDIGVAPDQVSVQTDGVVNTLVTTVDGDITVGDRVSPSSIIGFGAKNNGSGWVVGTAQGSLDAKTQGAVKSSVKDSSGATREVYVATVPVLINVAYYNAQQQDQDKTTPIPSKIQAVADSLAGRQASQVAVVLSFLLFLVGFIVAGIIVNAAVRNGISSIARQPLVKQAITRRMIQSFLMAGAIIVGAMISALVLLRVL